MKKILFNKYTASLLLLGFLGSCKDVFDEPNIKTNPNAVTDVDIQTLISGTEVGVANLHEDTQVRIAYMWAGQLTGLSRQHLTLAEYQVSSNTFGWGTIYPVASQARLIQTKADALGDQWTKGVGQVLEALVIEKATDLYGDVPYSEAFDEVKYPTPKFDAQAEVYAALLATLDAAIENLSAPTGTAFGSADFIYGGNVAKWKSAAYTLKARLYLHLADYPKAIASATLGISGITGDALVPHGTSQGVDENLNYDFFNTNRPGDTGFDAPAFLPVFMKTRIGSANTKTDETALYNHYFKVGVYGAGTLDPNTDDGVFTIDAKHPILTFYENQLILAESYARMGDATSMGLALAALNSVRATLNLGYMNGKTFPSTGRKYAAYDLTDFSPAGLANPKGYGDTQSALLYEIISQKYIVLLAQYEVFNDVRRLAKATPVVQLGIQPVVPTPTGGLPGRYIYPQGEINTNPNVPMTGGSVADQWQKLPIFQ